MMRRTKIVCTVGPATESEEMIEKLAIAGMNVARINFSHGTHEYLHTLVQRIKRVRAKLKKPVAILQDLQGPKIRIGVIGENIVRLLQGQKFILTAENVKGDSHRVSVSLQSLPSEVTKGHRILLADGSIELMVEDVSPPDI